MSKFAIRKILDRTFVKTMRQVLSGRLYIHASNSGLFSDVSLLPLHLTRLAAKLKIDEK